MKYLIRKMGTKNPAHLWVGTDTACRIYSTGGLNKRKYAIHETPQGRGICQMCRNVASTFGIQCEAVSSQDASGSQSRPDFAEWALGEDISKAPEGLVAREVPWDI